ncbi:hypothetical protein [Micromonospora sediminicola]|uniref:hypothetical protein n=1 Tax=Micromonospora sediminicola TaxID=946078 RepID=UPI0037A7C70E
MTVPTVVSPTDSTSPAAPAAGKPNSGDPKIRVKQVHPVVAKAMKHALSPPVLTTAALVFVGLIVLAWITVGWVGVIAFLAAVALSVFGGALAWKRAGIRKAAPRKQADRRGQAPRGSLVAALAALAARRAARRERRNGGGGQPNGGGGQPNGDGGDSSTGSRRSLLDRMRQRFGKDRKTGGRAAPNGAGGGGGQPSDGGKPLRAGGLRSKLAQMFRKPRGGGEGRHPGAAHSHSPGGGRPAGGDKARAGFRLPGFLRRKGPGGGGGDGAPADGGHKPTRRGSRGGASRNRDANNNARGTNRSGDSKKKAGFWRRMGRDLWNGARSEADSAARAGVPKKPAEQGRRQNQQAGKHQAGERLAGRPAATGLPSRAGGAPCSKCGKTADEGCPHWEEAYVRLQKVVQQKLNETNGNTRNAPTSGVQQGRNTTMGIRHNDDASLFAYLRNLTAISPVIGETATKVGGAQSQVAALAEGIKKMAVHGDSDQPASKKIVASVEALGQKISGYAQEMEDIIGKIRQAEAEAEALKAEADREHEMDWARREGGRGGLQTEMRADVSRGIQDT